MIKATHNLLDFRDGGGFKNNPINPSTKLKTQRNRHIAIVVLMIITILVMLFIKYF